MKRSLLAVATLAIALTVPSSVIAGRGDSVDPALMQPPLNPAFAPWECWRNGAGITCEGHLDAEFVGVETGLICDGRMMYTNERQIRTLRRHGDANGLGLWSKLHVDIRGTMGLEPDLSGPTLLGVGFFQEHFEYLVPGDQSTRTERYTGLDVRVTAPGVGLVVHDVGVKTFDIEGNVLFAKGPHPVVEDFEAAFAPICPAFEAIGA